ncbi:tRNA-dihydrouridine synthase 2 [Emydomyces testavorans]|uniref:tRNA-dihydrouridine synthase 2 n=1 Tax=Emydomyces testavorans TaxID=2070801 RepID=A0AAF0DJT2_9EURO|nr:tRNA-dihydrouridine synthase 2 [Emydomyces testavorans]
MTSFTETAPHVPIPRNGVDYRGKVVLAPMVRSGETPSRLVSLKYGADLVWGPETVDRAIIGANRRINPRTSMIEFTRIPSNGGQPNKPAQESVLYRIDPVREKGKLIFQLGTASPSLAVQAAKVVAGDVSGIDVNSGCPKPFSTSGGMGAALLQTPDLLVSILEALVEEVGKPYEIGISVKIRLLAEPERTETLVTRLCRTGITGLTVHCRTTPMRPREAAIREQLPMIASICRKAGVACLMNGDVRSRDEAMPLIRKYGVDGAMIATSAESNFSCFRSASDGGLLHWRDLARSYLEAALQCENRWGNTKYLLNQLIPGKEKTFEAAKRSKTYTECVLALKFDDLLPLAQQVDDILGMGKRPSNNAESNKSAAVLKAMEGNDTAKAAGMGGAAGKHSTSSSNNNNINSLGGTGPIRTGPFVSNSAPAACTSAESVVAGVAARVTENAHVPAGPLTV